MWSSMGLDYLHKMSKEREFSDFIMKKGIKVTSVFGQFLCLIAIFSTQCSGDIEL